MSTRSVAMRQLKPVKAFQERDDFRVLLFASFCLCFNAGFVNVVTMSSYLGLTTAHVTGLVAKVCCWCIDVFVCVCVCMFLICHRRGD
jgi:hypothetical protein